MTGGWQLFLFFFILGITVQSFNTFGLWSPRYPENGYTMETSTITTATDEVSGSQMSAFTFYEWMLAFLTIIFSGVAAVVSIGGLFYAMGWPVGILGAAILQLIQLPANLVIFGWLFEIVTGRSL